MKSIFIIILLNIFISLILFERSPLAATSLQKGSVAPDFTLQSLTGKPISLSDYRGKIVILNFWASWCSPCKEEMPAFQSFHEKYNNKGATILSINVTHRDRNRKQLLQFIKNNDLTFPILLDEKGKVTEMYQILIIPTTFVIDQKGMIQNKVLGPLNEAQIQNLLGEAN